LQIEKIKRKNIYKTYLPTSPSPLERVGERKKINE
jgi:hypothetical protein